MIHLKRLLVGTAVVATIVAMIYGLTLIDPKVIGAIIISAAALSTLYAIGYRVLDGK